ncbi:MAG: hypothetical protein JO131_02320 [Gammaproteobacteria bacterium]|nr:hypothetical protein [Gammaproteobacteria bacterium]
MLRSLPEQKEKPFAQELKEAKSRLLEIMTDIQPLCIDYHNPFTLSQNIRDGLQHNPYSLSEKQHENLIIVLSLMLQITDALEKGLQPHTGKSLQEDDGTVYLYVTYCSVKHPIPIHLEPYAQSFKVQDSKGITIDKSIKPGEERGKYILGCLVTQFISCYEKVSIHPQFMQMFCEKLDGNCLDARTRSAFFYASTGDFNIGTFTNILQKAYAQYIEEGNEGFFRFLLILMTNYMGTKFKPDSADTGFAKEHGELDLNHYELIKRGFSALEDVNINNDFLFMLDKLSSFLISADLFDIVKVDFIKILLQHEITFLETFQIKNEKERKQFNTLMLDPVNGKSFLHFVAIDCKSEKVARQFILNASMHLLENMTDIWQEPLLSRTIEVLEDKSAIRPLMLTHKACKEIGIENIIVNLNDIVSNLTYKEFVYFVKYSNLLNDNAPLHFKTVLNKAEKMFSIDQVLALICTIKEIPDIKDDASQNKFDEIIQDKLLFNYIINHTNEKFLTLISKISPDVLFLALQSISSDIYIYSPFLEFIISRLSPQQSIEIFKKFQQFNENSIQYLSSHDQITSDNIIDILTVLTQVWPYHQNDIIQLLEILFKKINKEENEKIHTGQVNQENYFNLMNLPVLQGIYQTSFMLETLNDQDVPVKIQCEIIKRIRPEEEKLTVHNVRIAPLILNTIYEKFSKDKQKLLKFLFPKNVEENNIIHYKTLPAFEYFYKKGVLGLNDFPLTHYMDSSKLNYHSLTKMLNIVNDYDAKKLIARLVPPVATINDMDFTILIKGIENLNTRNEIIKLITKDLLKEQLVQLSARVWPISQEIIKILKELEQHHTEYKGLFFSGTSYLNIDKKNVVQSVDIKAQIKEKLNLLTGKTCSFISLLPQWHIIEIHPIEPYKEMQRIAWTLAATGLKVSLVEKTISAGSQVIPTVQIFESSNSILEKLTIAAKNIEVYNTKYKP